MFQEQIALELYNKRQHDNERAYRHDALVAEAKKARKPRHSVVSIVLRAILSTLHIAS